MKKMIRILVLIALSGLGCTPAGASDSPQELFSEKLLDSFDLRTSSIAQEFINVDIVGYRLKKSAVVIIMQTMESISRTKNTPDKAELIMQTLLAGNMAIEQFRSEGYTLKSTLWGVGTTVAGGTPNSLTLFFEK